MKISHKHIKKIIRESLIKEGFFDLKDSPFLQGLGVVDKKEPPALTASNPGFDASNDPWVNLELALSTIPTIISARYSPVDEEEISRPGDINIIRPKIARHLDFDKDGATGDKDDILISFEKLNQIDAEFVESETAPPSNQAAIDFCKKVRGVGTSFIQNFFINASRYDIDELKQVFSSYLENQQEINNGFFAEVLNSVAESIIEKNIKSLIGVAVKNNPNSFTFVADNEIEPSKGVLTFPFQVSLLAQSENQNEMPVGSSYFKVDCELDFTDIYKQFENQQIMFGPLLDIKFSWKIKVQRIPSKIPNIAIIPLRVHKLNRPEIFKFIAGLDKLAKDILTLTKPFTQGTLRKFKKKYPESAQNRETWAQIIYYSENEEFSEIRYHSRHPINYNDEPAYLTDTETKVKTTNKLLSAIKHLKSEQGNLFKSLRSYHNGTNDYDAYKTAKRMVAVMEDIPEMGYSSQTDFVLSDYFEKLKRFIEDFNHSDPRSYHDYYPQAEESVKEFIKYVLDNNQKIVQGIRKQIKVLEGELNESVSHLIFERVKQRFKV
jgi:hypothetical protein